MKPLPKWPKQPVPLTTKQQKISDDWMQYWFEINRSKFSRIFGVGHRYVAVHSPKNFVTTLDIGAGLGEHLAYESLSKLQLSEYVCVELRQNMADVLQRNWPDIQVRVADCQQRLPFADDYFDRVIAIHVLEHLPDLPEFLREAHRLLNKTMGRLLVVIPCEGGFGYWLGRLFTSKRLFEKRYNRPYAPFIAAEHVNHAGEILSEVSNLFSTEHSSFYPLRIPSFHLNLLIGLTLKPRPR